MEKISVKAEARQRHRAATATSALGTPFTSPPRAVLGLVLAVAVALCALGVSPPASAQSSSSPTPPDQEWSVRDGSGFRSRNLVTGPLMQIRIDGSTPSVSKSSFKRTSTDRAENQTGLDFDADYSPRQNFTVRREMRVDPKRRAVRIIDIISNTEAQERNVRVDYSTSLSERGNVRYGGVLNQAGESREYGNGVPDETVAAVVFAERQETQALPFFVWGQGAARWPVNIQDVGSSVSLSYEGAIPANGKVALVHWVAVTGLDKSVKVERTADAFWKDGRLVDPMVPAEVVPLVVNFTPEALKSVSVAQPAAVVQPAGKLVHFEKLCGKLSVAREAKDVLWMGKDEQLRGDVTGSTVEVKMEGRTVQVLLPDIAGIRGGGGRGREHRVYLRSGAVLTGRASLGDCRLTGEIGNLTLDADALELLLLRVGEADGRPPEDVGGFVELQNGAVYWLSHQAWPGLQYVTVFGGFEVSLNELWSLERRTEPPFNLIATFADSSRIHGVAQQSVVSLPVRDADGKVVATQVRVADMVRFGSSKLLAREMALPASGSPPPESVKIKSEPPPRYCWLRDGSLLIGAITSPTLRVRAGGNDVELKSEDIARMTLDAASGNAASIELRSGVKMQGELMSESFDWQLGRRKVSLPAAWVQEVIRKDLPEALKEASTGENDPLALPKGVTKEDLVEMKVEYPKAVAEGPLRVWGTLSLPRLDKCDEESVKKRLTFLVPKGTTNVALKKPVTVSEPGSALGVISTITDGSAKDEGGEQVALEGGLQWVQIDLGEAHHIWKVLLWHYHRMPVVYQDVIVMVSNDPDFRKEVKVIFNNDHDNSSGLGAGPDIAYVETNYGWLMDGAGAQGRYVRFYSRGNSYSEKNDYLETMVFGTPVTPKVATPSPATPAPTTPKAAATPSAETNKPNDPDRLPTGYSRDDMMTRMMSFHAGGMAFSMPPSKAKFPHLESTTPPMVNRNTQVPLRITYPKGGDNVSYGKAVTSSAAPSNKHLLKAFVDNGASSFGTIELPKGLQWMQIDLGAQYHIWKIHLWHGYQKSWAVADVIVQVSDDENFSDGVATIFNSDHDNSSGLGRGADPAYIESFLGRVIDGCDAKGRYVRFYSNGNSESELNLFTEAIVYGSKVGTAAAGSAKAPVAADTGKAPVPDADKAPAADTGKEVAPKKSTVITPKYPKAPFLSGPLEVDAKAFPHFEKPDPEAVKARLSFEVPAKAYFIYTPKPVTCSVELAKPDELRRVLDGSAEASDTLELPGGLQWVQLDLGEPYKLAKLLLWHRFDKTNLVYHDVVVQASMDPDFKKEVTTLFNNDHDDSAKLGKGSDPAYLETNHGRLIEGKATLARYVRLYSRGNSLEDKNHYSEVMVIGAKADEATKPVKGPETPSPEKIAPAPTPPAASASGTGPAILSTKPTPAQLASTAEHREPRDPMALPFGYPEPELVTIRPLNPKGSPVPTVLRSANRLAHQEEHNVELLKKAVEMRVPRGTLRVSAGKPVTSSDSTKANSKDLAYVTDGHVRMQMSPFLNLAEGLQCVQIDLEAPHRIWKVVLWHDATRFDVYEDVIVQLSNDPEFANEVVTIFNNDIDNTSGMGKGPDPAYVETFFGRVMDGGGSPARYVRFYSRGNTTDTKNCYLEAAVFGAPVDTDKKATPEPNEPMPTVANNPLAPVKRMIADANITVTPPYPKAMYVSPPVITMPPDVPHLEKVDPQAMKERATFEVQRWSYNLAKRKAVTSSAPPLVEGSLSRLVDEDADAREENLVTLPEGRQWVQIDLGRRSRIWKVLLWHAHNHWNVAHDVLVQVSDDATFASGVQTIFNNDHDNSAGLGKGADPAYVETNLGRLIDGCGARGRYLRVTSRGSTASPLNRFAEVLVYGKPTPSIGPGESSGEKLPPLAEMRAKEDENPYSDTVRMLPMYPEPAPDASAFEIVSVDATRFPHLEKRDWLQAHLNLELRGPLRGYQSLAKYKPVTTSAPNIPDTELQRVTNGAAFYNDVLELPPGLQWVQLDLGGDYRLWNIVLWHHHARPVVYQDVVVQVSEDPEFKKDVTTVFNNDHDNSSGLGKGKDPAYVETNLGRRIDAAGALGRYVRCYTNGNSANAANHMCELWVYGGREPGTPGADEPYNASPTPPPGFVFPEGKSVSYTKDSASYAVSYASAGPIGVEKKDFPHLEQFDFERERSQRLAIPYPTSVRALRISNLSSSDPALDIKGLRRFVDGSVTSAEDIVMPGGLQWLQVDLGETYELWHMRLWHHINDLVVYQDVVVQASEDPEFKKDVLTLFNNDHDNSSGLGKGTDPAYVETQFGRLVPGFGARARYIRVYSRGNSREDVNRFAELKIYGREPKKPEISQSH